MNSIDRGVLDSIKRRGKRKDAMVACPQFFVPGLKVSFGRFNKTPEPHIDEIGSSTIKSVNEVTKVLHFDALPEIVRVGDLILLNNEVPPREVFING
jgi:hypothetical protein